jgi:hypothetical protein
MAAYVRINMFVGPMMSGKTARLITVAARGTYQHVMGCNMRGVFVSMSCEGGGVYPMPIPCPLQSSSADPPPEDQLSSVAGARYRASSKRTDCARRNTSSNFHPSHAFQY